MCISEYGETDLFIEVLPGCYEIYPEIFRWIETTWAEWATHPLKMTPDWPVVLVDENLRQLQECDVEMLVINGTVDFSTPPPSNLEAYKPYYHNAQTVLLLEYSHVGDVIYLQPKAFQTLVTSYYNTGIADDSLFEYQPIHFKLKISMVIVAKLLVAGMVIFPSLLVTVIVILLR